MEGVCDELCGVVISSCLNKGTSIQSYTMNPSLFGRFYGIGMQCYQISRDGETGHGPGELERWPDLTIDGWNAGPHVINPQAPLPQHCMLSVLSDNTV